MTALPATLADLEARMRAQSEAFDKSTERKAKGPEFINFTKPGRYVIRVLPSRTYPNDIQWYRKLGRHFIKPEGTSGMLFICDYHTHDTPCPICKAVKVATNGPDGVQKDVAIGKFGKGSAKSSAKYIINVVTLDKRDIVQTAEVPQSFIKFLRTFQDMVNMLFCDPQHGNLLAFDAVPAANGFGNEYKMVKQQPMPVGFSGEQIPDLDELLKAVVEDVKPANAFTGNLAAPLATTGSAAGFQAPGCFGAPSPAPTGFGGAAAPVPPPAANDTATNAFGFSTPPLAPPFVTTPAPAPDPFGAFAAGAAAVAQTPTSAPVTTPIPSNDPLANFASSVPAAPAAPVAPAAGPVIDGTFTAVHAAAAPPATPVGGISDADAALRAKLLTMVGQGHGPEEGHAGNAGEQPAPGAYSSPAPSAGNQFLQKISTEVILSN